MEYILVSTLNGATLCYLLIVYDIACQLLKNLWARFADLCTDIDINFNNTKVRVAIPKGLIKAHSKTCQNPFPPSYLPGSAQTNSKGVEHDWVHMIALTSSTWEMGPWNRQEALDDHWASWNWQQIVKLCMFFNMIYYFHYTDMKIGAFSIKNIRMQFTIMLSNKHNCQYY